MEIRSFISIYVVLPRPLLAWKLLIEMILDLPYSHIFLIYICEINKYYDHLENNHQEVEMANKKLHSSLNRTNI